MKSLPLPMVNELPFIPKHERKFFSHKKIAAFWGMNEPFFCMRCGHEGGTKLEKVHLIDLGGGGLDELQNLGLLCSRCHSEQPITGFSNQDKVEFLFEYEILDWFGLDPWKQCLIKPMDALGRGILYWSERLAYAEARLNALETYKELLAEEKV